MATLSFRSGTQCPALCPLLLHLPIFQAMCKRQSFPWRFNVFPVLHMLRACLQVPFAKQGRSHLHQSLERHWNSGDVSEENKSEFVTVMQLQRTVSASCPVCCAITGQLIPGFTIHVSIYWWCTTALHAAAQVSMTCKCIW